MAKPRLILALLFLVIGCSDTQIGVRDSASRNVSSNYRPPSTDEKRDAKAFAGYWPSLRGPHGDGISREIGILRKWPKDGPNILWEKPLGGGYGAVSVVDGRVFTMAYNSEKEWIHCLEAKTGKTLWKHGYVTRYKEFPNLDPLYRSGPRVTPVIHDGRLYALGSTGTFKVLNAKTGRVIWSKDLYALSGETKMPKFGYSNAPLIVGDSIFVQPGGKNGRSLAALDRNTGKTLWLRHNFRYAYSTPISIEVDDTPQIVFFTGNGPVAVNPDNGDLLWQYPWVTTLDINVATPIFSDGKLFISSAYGMGGILLRLHKNAAPTVVWKKKSMSSYFSTSVLYQGKLYGFSMSRLRCIDFNTGNILWDKPGLGRGSLLIADQLLIALGQTGELVLAEARPDVYLELARWSAFNKAPWNIPVLANGILYLRNEKRLLAIDLKAAS